jgi:tRNA nucleotidyltransferase (CCA-adding enzyme)
VTQLLERLWDNGHSAYVVGGAVRDWLLGRPASDWDVATDARPERMLELFPAGRYENRFGTVTINGVEATTFRRDHQYADHRRPDQVTFSDDIGEDLARRDFTVNAIAWGRSAGETAIHWQDPTEGRVDLRARVLRAVGKPAQRFDEDSLRLIRAARLAGQLDFTVEPVTLAAMQRSAPLVQYVSRERLGNEVRRMLAAERPSTGFRLLADTGLLAHALPLLEAQRGLPQDKRAGDDLWAHSLAALDAAASFDDSTDRLRLAALLHDVGKPSTFADGHFVGHDIEGARLADELLSSLAFGRREIEPVTRLIGQHMFQYLPNWSDAAVRRFIRRAGPDLVLDLLRLRQADNIGSGLPADAGRLAELRDRVTAVLDRHEPLGLRDLAIDGRVLTDELGVSPGPVVGRLLDHLLEFVIGDPARNSREQLLDEARAELAR